MPEETENYIHIPVHDAGTFVKGSFRTISISKSKGISAVIGKLKSAPSGSTKVQKYLFLKSKGWTMSKAKTWIKSHKAEETHNVPEIETEKVDNSNSATSVVRFSVPVSGIQIMEAQAADGSDKKVKKAVISGELFDDSINKNFFRINSSVHESLSSEIAGIATKVSHSADDWKVVGTGVSGEVVDNKVHYKTSVTHPEAVMMWETKTWNSENMGVSPSIDVRDAEVICSICGANVMKSMCEHWPGKTYGATKEKEGKVCWFDVSGTVHLVEMSFTSIPAYGPDSGTVEKVTFAASLMNILNKTNLAKAKSNKLNKPALRAKEDESMEEGTIDLLAEKEVEIKDLQAKVEKQDAKLAEFEKADVEKMKAELKETKDSLKASNDKEKEATDKLVEANVKLEVFVKAHREAELAKVTENKEVVASIIEKKLSDEDFNAEIEKIKKLKASYEKEAGSAPVDAGTTPTSDLEFDTKGYLASMGIADPHAQAAK